ncbi:MAG: type II secretion system GspH family protein [Patescibacteria group bacterium]|nr:type II secretion system GspH family protein [Patescibacteria group bacterium]
MFSNRKGFTLIELLVVIAIIGILAAVVTVGVSSARVRARDTKRKADMRTMQTALDSYYYKNSSYPKGCFFSPWDKTYWGTGTNPYPPTANGDYRTLYNVLVGNNYLASLPVDPTNKEDTSTGNPAYLGGGPTSDLGYVYQSYDGNGYILGTNLEQPETGAVNSACGNYQLMGGDTQNCGQICSVN